MIHPRLFGALMILSGAAVQAQQAPPPAASPQGTAATTSAKPDNGQKVTCRIHMEGNSPRRTCMTNAEWAKADSRGLDWESSSTQVLNPRCGFHERGGALGAC